MLHGDGCKELTYYNEVLVMRSLKRKTGCVRETELARAYEIAANRTLLLLLAPKIAPVYIVYCYLSAV
jgi:hypothetical protein